MVAEFGNSKVQNAEQQRGRHRDRRRVQFDGIDGIGRHLRCVGQHKSEELCTQKYGADQRQNAEFEHKRSVSERPFISEIEIAFVGSRGDLCVNDRPPSLSQHQMRPIQIKVEAPESPKPQTKHNVIEQSFEQFDVRHDIARRSQKQFQCVVRCRDQDFDDDDGDFEHHYRGVAFAHYDVSELLVIFEAVITRKAECTQTRRFLKTRWW